MLNLLRNTHINIYFIYIYIYIFFFFNVMSSVINFFFISFFFFKKMEKIYLNLYTLYILYIFI